MSRIRAWWCSKVGHVHPAVATWPQVATCKRCGAEGTPLIFYGIINGVVTGRRHTWVWPGEGE